MEFAVKWMYSVDSTLKMPYQDRLVTLMSTNDFKDIIGSDIFKRLEYIRTVGKNAAHNSKNISKDQTILALQNLFIFLDFIAYVVKMAY